MSMSGDDNQEKFHRKRSINNESTSDLTKNTVVSLEESLLEEDLVLLREVDIRNVEANCASIDAKKIKIHPRMTGLPIVSLLNNGSWIYDNSIKADFQINDSTVCIFLSVKYHMFHPNYIHERFKDVHHKYRICVFLILCDVPECTNIIKEINMMALNEKANLILSWSLPEAAHYIATLKKEENATITQEKKNGPSNLYEFAVDILTSIKGINSTDVKTLLTNFNTFKNIISASKDELAVCDGIGPQKAERLYKMFRKSLS